MRIRRKPWARPELAACPYFIDTPPTHRGHWRQQFARPEAPLWLELGCGKATFAGAVALAQPEVNLLAVDIKSEVLAVGRRNVEKLFAPSGRVVDNLLLMSHEIELLQLLLAPEDRVERIFINFCNPWPRTAQHKKRLTHPKQLLLYGSLLEEGAELWFKTDDDQLFQDSIEYFTQWGFPILYLTWDLHNSGFTGFSPSTEHEEMFTAQGIPTKFLIARYEGARTDAILAKQLASHPKFRPQSVPEATQRVLSPVRPQ